ncbi:TadE family protein [Microbacterium excoecariae]|uniref:TadE family protein n=1 Tax=Microbacterium excoecariae TaxID=2715210 RepID=UPI0014082044|nr:TadE family protein [Microbacterium excoecariae]
MLPRRCSDDDAERGSASLEFLVAGLVLLVPLVYLVVALSALQNAALGAETTARLVARSVASGAAGAPEAVRVDAAAAYGLDPQAVDMSVQCENARAACPEAGAIVVVTISTRVALPLVPDVWGLQDAAAVPIEARAAFRVERAAVP